MEKNQTANTADQKLEACTSFEMFSQAGNNACKRLTKRVLKRIGSKFRVTEDELSAMIGEGMKKIAHKYPEVYDTEPGGHIADFVNLKLDEIGYSFQVSRYNF